MGDTGTKTVFVFNGARSSFPSGVFESREAAVVWIRENVLSGTLTEYPLNVGVYDWAVGTGKFKPKRPGQETPNFIERFTSGAQWHEHYENGKTIAETLLE